MTFRNVQYMTLVENIARAARRGNTARREKRSSI